MLTNDDYKKLIKEIQETDINGCITGSAMWCLDTDISSWNADVDVFAYGPEAFIDAVAQARYSLGFKFSSNGEEWKWNRCVKRGINLKASQGYPVCTIKLTRDGSPELNISLKPHQDSVTDVLTVFDCTQIMVGYDIRKKIYLDYRDMWTGDKWIGMLNPLRDQDAEAYTVKKWLRQTDRLQKYHDRGFNMELATIGYVKMIDQVLQTGSLFQTEKSLDFYEECTKEFREIRTNLVNFLKEEYEYDYR